MLTNEIRNQIDQIWNAFWSGGISGEYLRERHPEIFRDAKLSRHFHHEFFRGFDFDNTMLRIGSMNMWFKLRTDQALPSSRSPIELQREFARRVRAVEQLKTAQRASLAELDALFASQQHRGFRGEL